jgi:hypothetical protein
MSIKSGTSPSCTGWSHESYGRENKGVALPAGGKHEPAIAASMIGYRRCDLSPIPIRSLISGS